MPDFSIIGWNFETCLLGFFALMLLVQLAYFLGLFVRAGGRGRDGQAKLLPVSVVICARNEADNLEKHLPLIFQQDYPEFQVVVVNDGSWDRTPDVLKEFADRHGNLHIVTISDRDEFNFTKKQALTLGVKGAKYEQLILTDADCAPADNQWLKMIASRFNDKKSIILGYSPYQRKKGLLNMLIRFDAFFIGVQYISFAKAGLPYMGVGRNLAYTKDLFFSVGGFRSHYHLQSGDDDLFVNQVGKRRNTEVEVRPASHTISLPKETWTGWWRQKKRHFTTARHYRFVHKMLLMLWPLSTVAFYVSFVVLLVLNHFWLPVLVAFGVRMLLQMIIFNRAMRNLGDKDLLIFAPLLEVLFLFLNPLIYGSNMLVKPSRWS